MSNAERELTGAEEQSKSAAAAEKDRAEAYKARHPEVKPEPTKYAATTLQSDKGEPVVLETEGPEAGTTRTVPGLNVKPDKDKAPTQEQNKLAFQAVVGKLDAAGLATGPTGLSKGLDEGLKRGVITPEEHVLARSYQAANPTPATNLQVHVAGQESGQRIRDRAKFYTYTDADGKTQLAKGDAIPPDAEGVLPVKDPEALGL